MLDGRRDGLLGYHTVNRSLNLGDGEHMKKEDLSKELWSLSNIITGFAVVQAIGFCYACLKSEFGDPKITIEVKMTITAFLILVTLAQCYAIYWCAGKCIAITETDAETDKKQLTQILCQAAWGRIIAVGSLLIPCLLCLFAPALKTIF
jgi:hypothetical protein